MYNIDQNNFAHNRWMTETPAIDKFSLNELTLPGTHNAGCDWKADWPLIPGRHWLACQHVPFYAQLHRGARALDLRLTYDAGASGLARFRFHHNGYRNSRTLDQLFADVNAFLRDNPDEFIIFDFHSLEGEPFDYVYFNEVITYYLGRLAIPVRNSKLSLRELRKVNDLNRIVIAAPTHSALDTEIFHPPIKHKWSGEGTTNAADLKQHIINVLKSPPGSYAPWSLSATSYSALGGPVDIHEELDEWFDPDQNDWAQQCNIINVDFFEESRIVAYCRAANLRKAGH